VCGRITLTEPDVEAIAALVGAQPAPELLKDGALRPRPRYNLPPTDPHMIVYVDGEKRLVPARWAFGTPKKGERPQINARVETAHKIGLFKRAFLERRCLVPADGFYEWMGAAKARRPIWYHLPDHGFFFLGGIHSGDGFAILTTAAGPDVAPVHDRMPVIIAPADADRWLTARSLDEILPLCAPAPKGTLAATPVSPRANSVANDDPACIQPA
jgi:putative SOS response-associated peptidase YedK